MNKVALYFGSFNPIHVGHIGLGEFLLSHSDVDELWFVVSPQNPLKRKADLWDDDIRLELARLAVSGSCGLSVSDVEFHLPIPSFTVNTLRTLSDMYPDTRFSMLIGADNYQIFDRWFCHDEILERYDVYVYPREGVVVDRSRFPQMHWLEAPLFPVSSTMVRERLAAGAPVSGLVSPVVEARILELKAEGRI